MFKKTTLIYLLLSLASCFAGVYGELEFGDDRKTVIRKLHASELVTSTYKSGDSIFGRVGLNGIFATNQKLANLSYSLYFDWKDDKLSAITLHSDQVAQKEYYASIQKAWTDALALLVSVHGTPEKKNSFPSQFKHSEDGMIFSHLWNIDQSTAVALGTGRAKDQYFLAIRFLKPSSL